MEQQEQIWIEPPLDKQSFTRRSLLPTWIKVFCWIFIITGVVAPLCLVAGIAGINLELALYGLETNDSLSMTGIFLVILFLFKGIVSYGLLTEKGWAVDAGIADAITGIAICSYLMVIAPFLNNQSGFVLNLRLELIALIPYLIKLRKIKQLWQYGQITL